MLSPSIKTTMHLHEEAHDLYRAGASLSFLDSVNVVNTKQCDTVRMEVWSQMYLQIMMPYMIVTCFYCKNYSVVLFTCWEDLQQFVKMI